VGGRIFIPPSLKEFEKLLGPPLLKQTHKRAFNSFNLGAGDFGDSAIAVNEATGDLLELKVSGYIGVNQDLCKLARSYDKLWNEVDGIVFVTPEFSGRRLIGPKLAVKLRRGSGLKTC